MRGPGSRLAHALPGARATALQPAVLRGFLIEKRKGLIDVGAIVAIAIVVLLVFMPILADTDNPPGVDIYYHLTHLDYMADEVRQGNGIPTWSPVLGLGYKYFINTGGTYPTGLYFLNLPLHLVTDDAGLTYVTSLALIFFMMGSGFYLGFRSRFGRPAAFLGAFVAMYGPYNFTAIEPQGRWPALMALAFLPAFFAAYMNLLDRPSRASFAVAAVTSGLALIVHPLVLYTALVGVGVYTVVWGMWQRIPIRRLVIAAASVVVGALIFWVFIPTGLTAHFFSSLLGQVGSTVGDLGSDIGGKAAAIGADARPAFALTTDSFTLGLRGTNENYAGLWPLVVTLLIPVLHPRRATFALAAVCLVLYAFALGNAGPFYSALPFIEGIAPRRFLHTVYLFQGLLVATALAPWLEQVRRIRWSDHLRAVGTRLRGRRYIVHRPGPSARLASTVATALPIVGIIATVVLLLLDALPMRATLMPWARDRWRDEAQVIQDVSTGGRLMWQATRDFSPMFHAYSVAGVSTIWSNGEIDRSSLEGFPEWGVSIMALQDVRFANTDEGRVPAMADELRKQGFNEVARSGAAVLLHNPRPPTPLQRPSRPVLLAGFSASTYWPMILPTSVGAGYDLAGLDPDYLRHFDAIVIGAYTAPDLARAEAVLSDFVDAGGIVFVEEGGLDGPNLWNIESERREVPRNLEVVLPSGGTLRLEDFSIGGGPFIGQFYPGGGTPVLEATDLNTGDTVALIRELRIGKGAVYHVCCNIGNHTYTTRDGGAVDLLRAFVDERIGLPESLWPEPFETENATLEDRSIRFSYTSDEQTAVVVSLRPDPAWTATVDGEQTPLAGYGPVAIIDLPEGEHSVALTYSHPLASGLNIAVNAGGLIALAVILGPLWRLALAEGQTPQWWAFRGAAWAVVLARSAQRDPVTLVTRGAVAIRVGAPRITDAVHFPGEGRRPDIAGYRIETEADNTVLVTLTIEIENNGDDFLLLDVGEDSAQVTTADGSTYRPIDPVARSTPVDPRDTRQAHRASAPLWGPVNMPPASVLRGQLIFEVSRDALVTGFTWHHGQGATRTFE